MIAGVNTCLCIAISWEIDILFSVIDFNAHFDKFISTCSMCVSNESKLNNKKSHQTKCLMAPLNPKTINNRY